MVEDYRTVIESRRNALKENLLNQPVLISLYTGVLSPMCAELDTESRHGRNWRGLASRLMEPDKKTIDDWFKCKSPSYELLCSWVDEREDEASFSALLEAMIANQSYSSGDELLTYLESLESECSETIEEEDEEGANNSVNDQNSIHEARDSIEKLPNVSSPSNNTSSHPTPAKRSKSFVGKLRFKWRGRKFNRSHSYPPDHATNCVMLQQPPKIEDEIFIVSSSEDSQSDAVRNLTSFVSKLEPVRRGKWSVGTIHDLPAGTMTTTWLTDRVDRAVYVIICCSNTVKQIEDNGRNGQLSQQAEYNLKFTLDFLITGKIYQDQCSNKRGKFVPLLLPGNPSSCVVNILSAFWRFMWPKDLKAIQNYIMGTSERPLPKMGPRMTISPCSLT